MIPKEENFALFSIRNKQLYSVTLTEKQKSKISQLFTEIATSEEPFVISDKPMYLDGELLKESL